jgi:glycosyltransferase involved in cell wall biosynthesis
MNNIYNNKVNLIFSIYPLTQKFRDNLESFMDGEYKYIELSTIRKKGAIGAVSELRKQKCDSLILAFESIESEGLISVLMSFALISRAKSIFLLLPDFKLEEISRWKIFSSLLQILSATFSGFYALLYASLDMRRFNKKPSKETKFKRGESVLYLNMNLWYGVKVGGSVGHIAGVVNEFNRDGSSVHYASISDSSVIDPEVNRILLNSPKSFGLPPEINSYRFDLFNYKMINKIVDNIEPSFIYQRLSVCSYTGAKLAEKLKIPLIVEYNGSEVWIARNWGRPLFFEKIAKKAEDVMLMRANVVVTISDVLRDELITRGVEPNKIVYYPNCIDPEIFNSERFSEMEIIDLKSKYDLSFDTKLVTFLGTFGQWHGVEILAKSIVDLVSKHRSWLDRNRVKFFLVGDGLKMPLVREIIREGDAENYCILTGLVEQHKAPLYLAASDVLVSPHVKNPDGTRFFGSPTKLFEYLSMGRPIIASNLEQIGEVLENSIHYGTSRGETDQKAEDLERVAYLVEPGDVDQLSCSLIDLIDRPDLQRILSKNSRKLALDKYTWRKHVDSFLQ